MGGGAPSIVAKAEARVIKLVHQLKDVKQRQVDLAK